VAQWLADLIFMWQWHNGLPILCVAVAQWLADLVVHVAVAQWLADFVCSSGTMTC
jgi:hypothetical protein